MEQCGLVKCEGTIPSDAYPTYPACVSSMLHSVKFSNGLPNVYLSEVEDALSHYETYTASD